MCRVKAKVKHGAIKSERVAYIKTSKGISTEVILSANQTGRDYINAFEITRDVNDVLIELPQETSSGHWRVWVNKNQILSA